MDEMPTYFPNQQLQENNFQNTQPLHHQNSTEFLQNENFNDDNRVNNKNLRDHEKKNFGLDNSTMNSFQPRSQNDKIFPNKPTNNLNLTISTSNLKNGHEIENIPFNFLNPEKELNLNSTSSLNSDTNFNLNSGVNLNSNINLSPNNNVNSDSSNSPLAKKITNLQEFSNPNLITNKVASSVSNFTESAALQYSNNPISLSTGTFDINSTIPSNLIYKSNDSESESPNSVNVSPNTSEIPFFKPTKQYLNIFSYDKRKIYTVSLIPKIDRGFFLFDDHWTCYRRNYFQVSAAFRANDAQGNDVKFPALLEFDNKLFTMIGFSINISAKNLLDEKPIGLVQHTPKRDKGPQIIPTPKVCKSSGDPSIHFSNSSSHSNLHNLNELNNPSVITFERCQFKSATVTPNGKRRTIAVQQFFVLVAELYAILDDGTMIKVALSESSPLVVRGRSPGHYTDNHNNNVTNSLTPTSEISSTSTSNNSNPSPIIATHSTTPTNASLSEQIQQYNHLKGGHQEQLPNFNENNQGNNLTAVSPPLVTYGINGGNISSTTSNNNLHAPANSENVMKKTKLHHIDNHINGSNFLNGENISQIYQKQDYSTHQASRFGYSEVVTNNLQQQDRWVNNTTQFHSRHDDFYKRYENQDQITHNNWSQPDQPLHINGSSSSTPPLEKYQQLSLQDGNNGAFITSITPNFNNFNENGISNYTNSINEYPVGRSVVNVDVNGNERENYNFVTGWNQLRN